MLIVAVSLVLVALVPLSGGSLRRLEDLHVRHGWLVLTALVIQTLVVSFPPFGPPPLSPALHLGSYLALAAFLWMNRTMPWLWVVAVGGAANALAVAANAGVMPASAAATRAAGLDTTAGYANSTVLASPRLVWLGDVFNSPRSLPLANVFSIGDVLIVVGLGLVLLTATRRADGVLVAGQPQMTPSA